MTKYIHYIKPWRKGLLISNKVDEIERGYKLGLEIDCDCFDSVLKHMMVSAGVPYDIQNDMVMNDSIFGFEDAFVRCMNVIEPFNKIPYKIKIHHGDYSTVYVKTIEQ